MRIAWISSDFKNSPQSHSDVGGGIQPLKNTQCIDCSWRRLLPGLNPIEGFETTSAKC